MSKRIVLLSTGSPVAQAMAQRMASIQADLTLIVREDAPRSFRYSALSELARHLIGHRLMNAIGVMKLPAKARRTVRTEQRLQRKADELFRDRLFKTGGSFGWPRGVEIFNTPEINNEATIARVREARPDLLVVFGTKLLKPPLIASSVLGAVNAHSSLLPAYRGLRSEFWQCYHNDPTSVGLTIHVVEPGVDVGDILFTRSTPTEWPTDPFLLRALNILAALEHFPGVVEDHLNGLTRPQPQGRSDQPTYRGKDITMEKRIELMERLAGG
ncbi:MAG: formyltransferase family protein [Flavobacteriales bacterium]